MVDEYGGTAGIVTVKDLVEEMIGEIGTDGTWLFPAPTGLMATAWWSSTGCCIPTQRPIEVTDVSPVRPAARAVR